MLVAVLHYVSVCVVVCVCLRFCCVCFRFFCQAEDGIRDLVRSRGLGDVYKRQVLLQDRVLDDLLGDDVLELQTRHLQQLDGLLQRRCLLYTSDAADERSSVDLGGRRIIKKKKNHY